MSPRVFPKISESERTPSAGISHSAFLLLCPPEGGRTCGPPTCGLLPATESPPAPQAHSSGPRISPHLLRFDSTDSRGSPGFSFSHSPSHTAERVVWHVGVFYQALRSSHISCPHLPQSFLFNTICCWANSTHGFISKLPPNVFV